jgi:hypothetical protein
MIQKQRRNWNNLGQVVWGTWLHLKCGILAFRLFLSCGTQYRIKPFSLKPRSASFIAECLINLANLVNKPGCPDPLSRSLLTNKEPFSIHLYPVCLYQCTVDCCFCRHDQISRGLWWTTLTPGLTTPMSAVHLYWCLGVGSDVTQSAVQFIQYHLSCKLDNGYVKILLPNRIGLLLEINGRLGLRIVANHGGIITLHEQI